MRVRRFLGAVVMALAVYGCGGGGDVNLKPTNVDNSVNNSTTTGGGSTNPCANYPDVNTNTLIQGTFDGTNCTYSSSFVGVTNPLTVDLTIPFISGVHIFEDSLFVGEDVNTGVAPFAGTAAEQPQGPTLTIRPGNKLAFLDSADYLLINRGSRIIANGSQSAPITFTGYSDAVTDTAGPEDVSLWGGIVINGNGVTNNCTDTQRASNDCHVESEGQPSNYGGNRNDESSGSLQYVVVKHTGFEVAPGDELNGITFNAVGSGTTVSHVQAYSTFDDGLEFFGGAVNLDHVVVLYAKDDSLDFSDGWSGTIDFALVIHALNDGNRCIEGDNVAEGRINGGVAADLAPVSDPTFRHLTCITSNREAGTHGDSEGPVFRFGARGQIVDSIVYGLYTDDDSDNECFEIETDASLIAAQNGDTSLTNTFVACEQTYKGALPNTDTMTNWALNTSAVGAAYAFNSGNRSFVNFATPPTLLQANSFLSAPTPIDEAGVAIVLPAGVTLGAVRASDEWTATWTYGLNPANRGQALWFE